MYLDIKILLRITERIVTDLEIVQYEIQDLRKTIIHEKKKRKRGKVINLYDEDEKESQVRFFSPEKIVRVRERNVVLKETQRQHQQAVQEKKL